MKELTNEGTLEKLKTYCTYHIRCDWMWTKDRLIERMDEWMNEWVNEWMNEWMRTMNFRIHESLNTRINQWDEIKKKLPTKKKSVRHNEKYAENSNYHNAFSL